MMPRAGWWRARRQAAGVRWCALRVLFARFLLSRVCPACAPRTRPAHANARHTMCLNSLHVFMLYAIRFSIFHRDCLFLPRVRRIREIVFLEKGWEKGRPKEERDRERDNCWQASSIDRARRSLRITSPPYARRAWKQTELHFVITTLGSMSTSRGNRSRVLAARFKIYDFQVFSVSCANWRFAPIFLEISKPLTRFSNELDIIVSIIWNVFISLGMRRAACKISFIFSPSSSVLEFAQRHLNAFLRERKFG